MSWRHIELLGQRETKQAEVSFSFFFPPCMQTCIHLSYFIKETVKLKPSQTVNICQVPFIAWCLNLSMSLYWCLFQKGSLSQRDLNDQISFYPHDSNLTNILLRITGKDLMQFPVICEKMKRLQRNKSLKQAYYPLSRKIVLFFNNWCFPPFITLKGGKKNIKHHLMSELSIPHLLACIRASQEGILSSSCVCACVEGVWRGHCLNWIIDWKNTCQTTVPYKRNWKAPTWKTGRIVNEPWRYIGSATSFC